MLQASSRRFALSAFLLLSTDVLGFPESNADVREQFPQAVGLLADEGTTCGSIRTLSTRVVTFNANHAEITDKSQAFMNLERALKGVLHEPSDVVTLMFQELLHAEFPAGIEKMMLSLGYESLVSSASAGMTKMSGYRVETMVAVYVKKAIRSCFADAEACAHVHMNGGKAEACGGFDIKVLTGIETKFGEIVEFTFKGGPSFIVAGVHMTTGGFAGDVLKLISALDPHHAKYKLFAGDFNTRIQDADRSHVCDGQKFSNKLFLESFQSSDPKKVWEIKDQSVLQALQKGGWSILPPGTAAIGKTTVVLPTYKYSVKANVEGQLTEANLGDVFGGACKGAKKVDLGVLDKIAVKDFHDSVHSETIPVQGSDHAMVTALLHFPLTAKAAEEEEVLAIV